MAKTDIDSRAIIDWLLRDGARLQPPAFVEGLAHRLRAMGLPVDRLSVNFGLLHPSLLAAGILWRPGEPMRFTRFDYANRDSKIFHHSPLYAAHARNDWVSIDLAVTPDEAFGIVRELKDEGLKHYHAVPLPSSAGVRMALTLATKSETDFTADQRALIKAILPAITAVVEIDTLRSTLSEVLAAYVGREPARQIIEGSIHRGDVTEVRAAILVADLRGFTHLSTQLPPEATADVINRYYDVVVPPIEARGGEVLKFIGDAVLAIFPAKTLGDDGAVLRALEASRAALDARPEPYELGGQSFPIRFGIAIHFGEAVYGNVGTGHRLDFTVIGRDVNIAARIASLCSRLGRDYLVSERVATVGAAHGRAMYDAGSHEVRGIDVPIHVFVPDDEAGATADDGVSQGLWLAPTV